MMRRFLIFMLVFFLVISTFPMLYFAQGAPQKDITREWSFLGQPYELHILLGQNGSARVSYEHYVWEIYMPVPYEDYQYYKKLPGGLRIAENRTYFEYFETPNDTHIRDLAIILNNISKKLNYDNLTEANFILTFVQNVPYVDDFSSTGYFDYYKFPLETLIEGGDCEDKSLLLYTLLDILGYHQVLFVMEVLYMGVQGHVAVGLNIENPESPFSQYLRDYYTYQGRKYYYMESTGSESTSLVIGGIRTVHYWVGISPQEAGLTIKNLTIVPLGNWHYSGYNPGSKYVRNAPPESPFPWYLVILTVFTLIFVPFFIWAVVRERRCPRCQYPLREDFQYCPNCGMYLVPQRPPPPPTF